MRKRMLNFHEPGHFIAERIKLEKRARLEELKRKIAEKVKVTGIEDAAKLVTLSTNSPVVEKKPSSGTNTTNSNVPEESDEEVPDIEWWDEPILSKQSLDSVVLRLNQNIDKPENIFKGITNLIEHPYIKKPPGPANFVAQVPIFLTKKERKKLRRQNRRNAELEKQEQIKLGLLPKPEPKLKRSNIMHVLGDEAIINPSVVEQRVREQEDKRKQAHLEHNEAKKLSLEEKKAKKIRKIQEDLNITGVWVSVYRVLDLSSQAHKFKITENAKQLTMTGVLVLLKDLNLVVVEGGPKQQRKFKHLMMDRIKWADSESVAVEDIVNRCYIVWEGQVKQRSFRGFQVKKMRSETEAKVFFQKFKVEHYWDLAFKLSILESIEDN